MSPCILPVLPFVFARGSKPFLTGTLPLLLGMCVTFAAVASLAAVGGGWAVSANQYGRIAALVLLALFGITLLSRHVADTLTRPLVALGNRLSANADAARRCGRFVPSGHRHRIVMGAVRGPDPGPGADRRGHRRRQRAHDFASAGLCAGRGHIAGAGVAGRRPPVPGDETITGCGRMGAPRAGRGGSGGRGSDCFRARHRFPDAVVAGQHHTLRGRPDQHAEARAHPSCHPSRRQHACRSKAQCRS